MLHLIKEISLSENKKNFVITDLVVTGNSLLEKAKNKNLAMNYLRGEKSLKVVGKSNQINNFLDLEKHGIRLRFPPKHQREIFLSRLFESFE